MWQQQLQDIQQGNIKALARSISLVENEVEGYEKLLQLLPPSSTPVIGITGPPGAGKSTLVDALTGHLMERKNKIAIVCIDPSSPFSSGALLGDRIRMGRWYNNANVYIRSLASRGSLGGLQPKIIEITDLLKAAPFDYIFVETIGVGQSEVEIAGLADTTIVVMVPESGDDIQTMKAGLMEIADIFVVNKADRADADVFVKNLQSMLAPVFRNRQINVPVLKTVASKNGGINSLLDAITTSLAGNKHNDRRLWLLAEKAYQLIQQKKMAHVNKTELKFIIELAGSEFNLYKFIGQYQ